MQSALSPLSCSPVAVLCAPTPAAISFLHMQLPSTPSRRTSFVPIRSNDPSVDYSSTVSVFPAEACETIGGDTCLADMYPEAKLKPVKEEAVTAKTTGASKEEAVEREYLDYADPKTVLLDEACDVLGGEFCQPPYQQQQNQT